MNGGFISNTKYDGQIYSFKSNFLRRIMTEIIRIICIRVKKVLRVGGYGYVFNDYELKKGEKVKNYVVGRHGRIPLKDNPVMTDKLPYTSSSAGSCGSFVYKDNKLLICAVWWVG